MTNSEGPHHKYMKIEFYAQRGLVTVIDVDKASDSGVSASEALSRVPPSEFIKRAIAVRMSFPEDYASKNRELSRFLEEAKATVKLALAQGDPTDPKVRAHVAKHRRRSSAIILPGEANRILGPVGGQKYKIRMDDPRKMLLRGVTVVPDLTIPTEKVMSANRAAFLQQTKPKA